MKRQIELIFESFTRGTLTVFFDSYWIFLYNENWARERFFDSILFWRFDKQKKTSINIRRRFFHVETRKNVWKKYFLIELFPCRDVRWKRKTKTLGALELIRKCLTVVPADRFTVDDIAQHRWINYGHKHPPVDLYSKPNESCSRRRSRSKTKENKSSNELRSKSHRSNRKSSKGHRDSTRTQSQDKWALFTKTKRFNA